MNLKRKHSLLSLLLVLILVLSLGACKKKEKLPEPEPEPEIINFWNALPMPDKPDTSARIVDNGLSTLAVDKHDLNSDTIGWLQVPNTSIDDPVLYYPDQKDKFHYLRRDFDGNNSWEGSYFVDYRSKFEGERDGMSRNSVIYGHSMEDEASYPLFSQLKKYRTLEFAKENPYFYFSTLDEDIVWEIFAVFTTTVNFSYNQPNPDDTAFADILAGARSRSIYNYDDVEVGMEDKIMTLSTCIYNVNGMFYQYPNNFRYVVMAKQVPATAELKLAANLTENATIAAP